MERAGGVKEEKEVMVEEEARVARGVDMGQKYFFIILCSSYICIFIISRKGQDDIFLQEGAKVLLWGQRGGVLSL